MYREQVEYATKFGYIYLYIYTCVYLCVSSVLREPLMGKRLIFVLVISFKANGFKRILSNRQIKAGHCWFTHCLEIKAECACERMIDQEPFLYVGLPLKWIVSINSENKTKMISIKMCGLIVGMRYSRSQKWKTDFFYNFLFSFNVEIHEMENY